MDDIIKSRCVEKRHQVSRFHQTDNEYILSTQDGSFEFHLDKGLYNGKMPPKFRWLWQRQELELKLFQINDFVVSAELDGVKLFEISEEDFPERIKQFIQKLCRFEEKMMQSALEDRRKREDKLKQKLQVYISNFPVNKSLEEEATSLPVCLRTYFKLHLLCGKRTEDRLSRLSLMLEVLKVVELWCRRYEQEGPLGAVITSMCFINVPFDWFEDVEMYRSVAKEDQMGIFRNYDEVKEIISEHFPPIEEKSVRDYLIYIVQKIAVDYTSDCVTLDINHATNAWGERVFSDEQDYKEAYKKMKMRFHSNFILPETFDEEQQKYFFSRYNLK